SHDRASTKAYHWRDDGGLGPPGFPVVRFLGRCHHSSFAGGSGARGRPAIARLVVADFSATVLMASALRCAETEAARRDCSRRAAASCLAISRGSRIACPGLEPESAGFFRRFLRLLDFGRA